MFKMFSFIVQNLWNPAMLLKYHKGTLLSFVMTNIKAGNTPNTRPSLKHSHLFPDLIWAVWPSLEDLTLKVTLDRNISLHKLCKEANSKKDFNFLLLRWAGGQ